MRTPGSTLAVACTSLFVIGIFSGALGPLLPSLAVRLGAPVDELGAMFTAFFVGALVTQIAGGWLNEHVGLRTMVITGTAVLTLGAAGVTVSPNVPLLLASALVFGLGLGAVDISANVLVAAVFSGRRAVSAVNVLHFAFGAGAGLAPVLASLALGRWGTPMPVLYLAAAIGLANALVAGRLLLDRDVAPRGDARQGVAAVYRAPSLWMLALLLFLYVGGEMGVGGWTTVYLGKTTSLAAGPVAVVVSAFWLALTGGRLLGAFLGARVHADALLLWSAGGCCLGALLLLLGGGSVALTVAGTLILGVAYGPIFPTALVLATEHFPLAPSRAVSVVVSVSSLGGMLLPPLQGILLERVSPLASVGLVAAGTAGMMGALLAVRRAPAVGGNSPRGGGD